MEPRRNRPRQRAMHHRLAAAFALVVVMTLAACSPAAPGPTPTPSPSPAAPADTAEAAVAAIQARTPWFDGIHRKDPSTIGQAAWWEARQATDSWLVTFTVGWGDCQAGCINRHQWTWHVAKDGTVTFGSENGTAVPADQLTALAAAATGSGVGGTVTSGPSCPVAKVGDTACDPRPVEGAVLLVRDSKGTVLQTVTTDASGLYRVALPPGDYTLEPQPVKGVLGTARTAKFTVTAGALTIQAIAYDTGIR